MALAEYVGIFKGMRVPHGNNGDKGSQYVRTPAATMTKIGDNAPRMPPKAVYNKLLIKEDFEDASRNVRVIRNQKAWNERKKKEEDGITHCSTFADEFVAVHNMMQHDDFIRCIIACKNRIPRIVLYTEDQIRNIHEFCFDRRRGSVLGFDKTYNLGDIYITPSVYKNKALQRH